MRNQPWGVGAKGHPGRGYNRSLEVGRSAYTQRHVTKCMSGGRVWSDMFVYIDVRDYACTSIAATLEDKNSPVQVPQPDCRTVAALSAVK